MNIRFRTLFPMLVLLAAMVLAQHGYAETLGAVSGLVRDTSGKLLPGAVVRLSLRSRSDRTVANAEGVYRFTRVPPGSGYRLSASARRHVTSELGDLMVAAGQTSRADLALAPNRNMPRGTITGTVRGPDGSPVIGARVEVLTGATDGRTTTTRSGAFRLRGLAAGTYALNVSSNSHATTVLDSLTVGRGTTTVRVQLEAPAEAVGAIFGVVRDPAGHALPGTSLEITDGPTAGVGQTDQHGHYELPGLSTGTYTVRASIDGFRDSTWGGIVVVAGHGVRVDFALHHRQEDPHHGGISGTVTAAAGHPLHAAVVEVVSGPSPGRTTTDAHGVYTLPDLLPGVYVVQASLAGFLPRSSEVVVVAGRTSPLALALESAPVPGSVRGAVRDAQHHAVHGVLVEIIEDGVVGGHTTTDVHGVYHLGDLPPGTYRLRFSSPGYESLEVTGVLVQSGHQTQKDLSLTTAKSG